MNTNVKKQINLQDLFLEKVKKERIAITIIVSNGYQMKGIVRAFDTFTILLIQDGKERLVYKSSISTIEPRKALDLEL